MIKTILAWITGKSDTKAAEAPYKVEVAPTNLQAEGVVEAPAPTVVAVTLADLPVVTAPTVEVAPVTVKAKYKKAELNKMTKKDLLALAAQHGVEVKSRATKEELVKVLAKV